MGLIIYDYIIIVVIMPIILDGGFSPPLCKMMD